MNFLELKLLFIIPAVVTLLKKIRKIYAIILPLQGFCKND